MDKGIWRSIRDEWSLANFYSSRLLEGLSYSFDFLGRPHRIYYLSYQTSPQVSGLSSVISSMQTCTVLSVSMASKLLAQYITSSNLQSIYAKVGQQHCGMLPKVEINHYYPKCLLWNDIAQHRCYYAATSMTIISG